MTNPELVENLLLTFNQPLNNLSHTLKEMIVKEQIGCVIVEIVEKLNEMYKDVHFMGYWFDYMPAHACDDEGRLFVGGYNRHTQSDRDDEEEDDDEINLPQCDIEQLVFKLSFTWMQKCDLGHTHRTQRFHLYSMAKVMEMISLYLNIPEWKEMFFKNYVPNFFY